MRNVHLPLFMDLQMGVPLSLSYKKVMLIEVGSLCYYITVIYCEIVLFTFLYFTVAAYRGLYCLVTEALWMWTTCTNLLCEMERAGVAWSQVRRPNHFIHDLRHTYKNCNTRIRQIVLTLSVPHFFDCGKNESTKALSAMCWSKPPF